MTAGHALLVAAAGFLAGAVNAVAGGGTLISFPALLIAGLGAKTANITSSVGLITGYAGGSVAYRAELAGQRRRFLVLAAPSVIGGVAGAVILLVTPGSSFRAVIPYLILASCGLLAVQRRLARVLSRRAGPERAERDDGAGGGARVGVGAAAVYGSYFGAGLGVLLLAVLGLVVDDDLQRLNALKGLLSLLINLIGVIVFLVAGHVAWGYAGILAVTAFAGGTVGVRIARRLPAPALRAGVVILGVAVSAVLLAR